LKLFGAKIFFFDKIWGDRTLLEKYAPGIDSWEQLVRRSEIIIIENDYHLDTALPLLPHVVTAAGSTAHPPKPLPENLEKIMEDSGEHGVILASFGSSAYKMPAHMATKFLEAYGRLKETVLTKMAVPPGVKVSTVA
jgi:glucuronosyltransferase